MLCYKDLVLTWFVKNARIAPYTRDTPLIQLALVIAVVITQQASRLSYYVLDLAIQHHVLLLYGSKPIYNAL